MVARKQCHWCKVDIGGAYPNALPDKNDAIFMVISRQLTKILVKNNPKLGEYVDEDTGTLLIQILKALYGLVQAAALWYQMLSEFLRSLGFFANPLDKCILVRNTVAGVLIIILYGDDILLLAGRHMLVD